MDNGYDFKSLDNQGLKDFHEFLKKTVYKGLTISDVDKLYKRKRDANDTVNTVEDSGSQQIEHYGFNTKKKLDYTDTIG
ncbi:MAG6450 family protein [Mycoplasma sp. Ms02]|uniref:MAG6450 family protein n=1 Tax=Mycoplasma sp. Ms02 TaxID=353851 RepID=UPI001C8A9B56|nr:hypothetical protein [Mycoplasma sp. Ms02]QZE12189.1 hypothetical protein K4L35_02495 [Mycoplasma sp. Ms02]